MKEVFDEKLYIKTYMKKWRENHREYMKQHNKKWREIHKDYVRDYAKKWREVHKDYMRDYGKWYIKHVNYNEIRRNRRHKLGTSKKNIARYGGKPIWPYKNLKYNHTRYMRFWRKKNPEKAKQQRQFYKYNKKEAGLLTIETIQRVYEENIKAFGTLTCIYCLKPIQFGKDTLEHIISLTKGGTNKYKNLAIACKFCNISKGNKTLEEWFMKK